LKPIDPEILRAKVRVFCDLFIRGEEIRRKAVENEVKDEFLASVVHELRTPLAAAKAQTQLALHQISEKGEDANAARALRVISRQIDRLVRLVGDLLDVNRLDGNHLELNPTDFDLSALLEEVRARMQTLGDRHPIRVAAAEGIHFFGDRDRIDQAVTNILSNAVRYSPDGGEIEIAVQETPEGLHLTVRDHGLGIPKDQQQHIFERFARAHGTSYGGLGLGLAITKGIIEQHGGTIWVESDGIRGKGSTFHLRLPQRRAERPVQEGASPQEAKS
jgi:signal transduction histidine kinase